MVRGADGTLPPGATGFAPGQRVRTHSLKSESANGVEGVVVRTQDDRVVVALSGMGEKALRPANLQQVAEAAPPAPAADARPAAEEAAAAPEQGAEQVPEPAQEAPSEEERLKGLGGGALRKLAKERGVDISDCLEKAEIVRRLAAAGGAAPPAADPPPGTGGGRAGYSGGVPASRSTGPVRLDRKLAGWDCILRGPAACIGGGERADLAVIFLHGFGATNDNFADLADATAGALGQRKVVWVLPQAPDHPALGCAAWWTIDVMRWQAAVASPDAAAREEGLARLIRDEPEGLVACREQGLRLVEEVRALCGDIEVGRVCLGGFSQGAMTAADLALSLPTSCAGAVMLSGAPIVVEQWAGKLPRHPALKVFMSHGRTDMVLPFAASGWAKDLFSGRGLPVEFVEHMGGHTDLPPQVFARLAQFLAGLISDAGVE